MRARWTVHEAITRLSTEARRRIGPLGSRRSGYFFIWSRAIRARVGHLAEHAAGRRVDVVTLDDLPRRAPGATYRELEAPVVRVMPPPDWVWPQAYVPAPLPERPVTRGQGVLEIPGGVVFGSRGHYGTDPQGLLAACALWRDHEQEALVDAVDALDLGLAHLDGVTTSVWANGVNYAHCLLQSVPRIDLLRRGFGLDAGRILVNEGQRATREALDLLGVPAEQLHLVPPVGAPAYQCETLRAATSLDINDVGDAWSAGFLNEVFLPVPPERDAGRRLYVRRGVAKRVVLNEDEVLTILEPWGFEAVTMDGRSISEQASMFASAAVVVAPHGAALANLVFARPGTTVIELIGTNTATSLFASLAWRRGLDYQMVMGTEPAPPRGWWTWRIDADTVVDVRELAKRLARLSLP